MLINTKNNIVYIGNAPPTGGGGGSTSVPSQFYHTSSLDSDNVRVQSSTYRDLIVGYNVDLEAYTFTGDATVISSNRDAGFPMSIKVSIYANGSLVLLQSGILLPDSQNNYNASSIIFSTTNIPLTGTGRIVISAACSSVGYFRGIELKMEKRA